VEPGRDGQNRQRTRGRGHETDESIRQKWGRGGKRGRGLTREGGGEILLHLVGAMGTQGSLAIVEEL
jgi:hypothetical protein